MIKLDDNLLTELGLQSLPAEEKRALLRQIYETLEMRVGTTLARQMTDTQLDEFESFINSNDEAGALRWLETNFPNYKDVVSQEFDVLKGEVMQAAPQIVANAAQAAMQQPQQPMVNAPAPNAIQPQVGQQYAPQAPSQADFSQAQQQPQQPGMYVPASQQPVAQPQYQQQPQMPQQPYYGQAPAPNAIQPQQPLMPQQQPLNGPQQPQATSAADLATPNAQATQNATQAAAPQPLQDPYTGQPTQSDQQFSQPL